MAGARSRREELTEQADTLAHFPVAGRLRHPPGQTPIRVNHRPIAAGLLLTGLPLLIRADAIRLAGSDLAKPAVAAGLASGATGTGAGWVLAMDGTRPGLEALRAGSADGAVVLVESLPAGRDPAVEYMPLAYRVPVIVVSAGNPLAQIELPALAAVLGEGEAESFRRWSELGLPGEWSARTISILTSSGDDPLLLDFLRHRLLKSGRLRTSVATGVPTEALLARLREDESALGILGSPPADMNGLKALPLALDAGGIGFGPTAANVYAGDYPLRMVLAVAYLRDPDSRRAGMLRTLLSDGVANALAGHGFVPAPAGVRARLADSIPRP